MKINYLTWLKKELSLESEEINLPQTIDTLDSLILFLMRRGEPFATVFGKRHVIFTEADGQVIENLHNITECKEISFFSPIVGG